MTIPNGIIVLQVAASLSKEEFRVKLDPEMFELEDIPLEKYFFKLNDQAYCFIEGTDVSLTKVENRFYFLLLLHSTIKLG